MYGNIDRNLADIYIYIYIRILDLKKNITYIYTIQN